MKLHKVQEEAAERIVQSYLSGSSRALLQMAQGSGKTLVAQAALERIAARKGALSVAWVHQFDAEVMKWHSESDKTPEQINVTYLKYSKLLSDISSTTIPRNAFDVLVVVEPSRVLDDLEKVMTYFSGFKVVFFSVPLRHKFFSENQKHLIYQYTFDHALSDGVHLSIALQSTLKALNQRFRDGVPATQISDDIKLAEEESRELKDILKILRQGKVSLNDIRDMQDKRDQLQVFQKLLDNETFFRSRIEGGSSPESVWQGFFQENQWIFGFGLNYLFNTPLQGGKLEQVVAGHSVKGAGKRVDALLSSNGLISSLCFAEIKTHRKPLLRQVRLPYRPDAWAISDELAGGIAQIQRTVQVSMENLKTSLTVRDDEGYDCGEKLYMYKPKSFLVIGTLAEFTNDNGSIHEARFSSFQMFRNALSDVEVITFDELYERAKGLIGPSAEL